MKLVLQIGVVFLICFLGQTISVLLPIAIPGTVISMIILFLILLFRVIKLENIILLADFLLQNMAFFFVPAGVSIMANFSELKDRALALIAVIVISTFLVFGSTALTVSCVIRLLQRINKEGSSAHE